MTTTITHDPDDPRGCIACPLFHGVPRDGGCLGLNGRTLDISGGTFDPDPDCPLRNGGVHVRAPEPAADHHEPAEGDAVRVEAPEEHGRRAAWHLGYAAAIRDVRGALTGEPRGPQPPESGDVIDRVEALRREVAGWREIADRASRDLGTATSALGSIASAVGMSPDALPGAIVERVETMAVSLRAAAMHEAAERIGEVLDGMTRPERGSEPTLLVPTLDRIENLFREEGRPGDGVEMMLARLVRERDAARRGRRALDGSIEAALGDACTGDLAADVRRVVEALDERKRALARVIEQRDAAREESRIARARIAELERGTDRGEAEGDRGGHGERRARDGGGVMVKSEPNAVEVRAELVEIGGGVAVFEGGDDFSLTMPVSREQERAMAVGIYEPHTLTISIERVPR